MVSEIIVHVTKFKKRNQPVPYYFKTQRIEMHKTLNGYGIIWQLSLTANLIKGFGRFILAPSK